MFETFFQPLDAFLSAHPKEFAMSFGNRPSFGRRGVATGNDDRPAKETEASSSQSAELADKAFLPDGGIRPPIAVVQRFAEAVAMIHSDAVGMASTIRSDGRIQGGLPPDAMYWPIRSKDSEKLFEHLTSGGTRFITFIFTTDLANVTAAQPQIGMLYNLILDANMMSHGFLMFGLNDDMLAKLKSRLDAILVKSAFLIEALKTYPLILDRVTKRIDKQTDAKFTEQLFAQQMQALVKVRRVMFEPEKLASYVPYSGPCFVVAVQEPYEEGQMIIDGVHYRRSLAAPIMEYIQKKRAAAAASNNGVPAAGAPPTGMTRH
jgi:hypothetical protein